MSGIERAREELRPGLTAAAFDALVREAVIAGGGTAYAHHSGHSIGVSVHENPRLVPGDETVLEPGMVIMVEPSSYETGVGGARSEWMFLVTETGNEVISAFDPRRAPLNGVGAPLRSCRGQSQACQEPIHGFAETAQANDFVGAITRHSGATDRKRHTSPTCTEVQRSRRSGTGHPRPALQRAQRGIAVQVSATHDVCDPSLDLSGNGTTNQFELAQLSAKPSVGSWHAWLCPRQDQSSEDPQQRSSSEEQRAKSKTKTETPLTERPVPPDP